MRNTLTVQFDGKPQAPPRSARDPCFDVLRGGAMVLVVLGHAAIGVLQAGGDSAVLRGLVVMIYAVHMPLFFVLSALLAARATPRRASVWVQQIGARILWPYMLWSVILLAVHTVMSGYTNTQVPRFEPLSILWAPPAVMWFLVALGAAMTLHRALPRKALIPVGLGLLAAPYVTAEVPQAVRFVGLYLIVCGTSAQWISAARHAGAVLCAAVVLMLTAMWAVGQAQTGIGGYPAFDPVALPAMVAGPVFGLWLAQQGVGARALADLGQRAMPVFVLHILFTAGTRIGLMQMGVQDIAVLLVSATAAGIMGPVMASHLADRWGLTPWLGWR